MRKCMHGANAWCLTAWHCSRLVCTLSTRQNAGLCGQVVEAVGQAGTDERVKGMLVSFGSEPGVSGLAQTQELRQTFQRFR